MFANLMALLSSGVLFNPAVLCGAILGIIFEIKLDYVQIVAMYQNWHFYALGALVALLHNFTLVKVYQDDGLTPDYKTMLFNSLKSLFGFVFASLLAMALVWFVWI